MNTHCQFSGLLQPLAPILLASSLVACSSGNPASNLTGASSDRIVTRGAVTALDTVSVNGRPFSVSNASIYLDDQLADESALRTGMQVIVQRQGETATGINYEEDVKGPVDGVDSASDMHVMGQPVVISSSTVFDNSSIESISAGDIVEVSGLRDINGSLHASFIEKKRSVPNAFKVFGPITQLNTSNQTFLIGDLTIDYSGARFDDFSELSLRNGVLLEVKDENLAYEPGSFFFNATKIEQYPDVISIANNAASNSSSRRTEIEIEAFITEIISDDQFRMNNLTVRVLPTTRFKNGEKQQLQLNSRLEVEGWLSIGGELEAWEIEFENGSDFFDSDDDDQDSSPGNSEDDDTELELEGVVSAINADNGLLVINGIEVRVDNRTEFESNQDQPISRSQFFNLINVGNTVVKVKWKRFSNHTEAPHEVEIEI